MSVPSPTSPFEHNISFQDALTILEESGKLEFSLRGPSVEEGEAFCFTNSLGRIGYVSYQWIEDLRQEAGKFYPRVLSQRGFNYGDKTEPKLTVIHILVLRNLPMPK